jgi:hypothetical protein
MEDMVLSDMIEDINISRHMLKIRRTRARAGGTVFESCSRRGRPLTLL